MERLESLKDFCLEHKYWFMVGGVLALLFLVIIVYVICYNSHKQEEISLLEDVKEYEKSDMISKEIQQVDDSCKVMVDVKGEIETPGLYQVKCDSRVQDVIDLAGGLTWKADTSILNLSKKVVDEMVIIIYSKEQVTNFENTKETEIKKQESCLNQMEIKNGACAELITSIENNKVIGDTPVNSLISLNTASKEELMSLSGIGESKADNIILYRKENGSFKNIEEVKNVKGIGDSVFEKIKDSITV